MRHGVCSSLPVARGGRRGDAPKTKDWTWNSCWRAPCTLRPSQANRRTRPPTPVTGPVLAEEAPLGLVHWALQLWTFSVCTTRRGQDGPQRSRSFLQGPRGDTRCCSEPAGAPHSVPAGLYTLTAGVWSPKLPSPLGPVRIGDIDGHTQGSVGRQLRLWTNCRALGSPGYGAQVGPSPKVSAGRGLWAPATS